MKVTLKKTVDCPLFKRVPYLCEAGMQLISVGTSRSLRIRAKFFQKCPTALGKLNKQQLLLTSRPQPTFTYFLLELLLPTSHPALLAVTQQCTFRATCNLPELVSPSITHATVMGGVCGAMGSRRAPPSAPAKTFLYILIRTVLQMNA